MCQSVPGPPMPCFCGTELCFRRLCNFDLPNKQRFSLQRHKTREFGEAEFSDCLPVSASVCVFAFDTGGLGLWLGAFGRSRLYRCQSVPGPPMPCFCGTELRFCRLCNFDLPNKQRFSLQRHKSCRIRHSPNSGTVRRFPVLPTPCAKTREFGEAEFSDCLPVSALECFSANKTGFLIRGFGSLYNLGLSKEQRFFWKGTKAKSCKT